MQNLRGPQSPLLVTWAQTAGLGLTIASHEPRGSALRPACVEVVVTLAKSPHASGLRFPPN